MHATILALMLAAPPAPRTVLVIHGGAGVMSDAEMAAERLTRRDFEAPLADALRAGHAALQKPGATGADAVEAALRVLEDCELFNAGRGAALTSDGRAELDASIMEGAVTGAGEGKRDPRKRAGAVTGVTHVKNPISAARAVMEMPASRHVLLAGAGAEEYVLRPEVRERFRIERVSNAYFWTERRLKPVREQAGKPLADAGAPAHRFGTVGAVALDARGTLTAGTSTGGVTNKMPGRVGDAPVLGAGTYADDRACGVSCTGTGELFLRHAVAHDVVARMVYGKATVTDAARAAVDQLPDEPGGVGGLIALDAAGRHAFALSAKCNGMYRGYVTAEGKVFVGVFAGEAEREGK